MENLFLEQIFSFGDDCHLEDEFKVRTGGESATILIHKHIVILQEIVHKGHNLSQEHLI